MKTYALVLVLALSALFACGHASPVARRPDARLALKVNVPDARVYIDEKFVGRAADLGDLPLPSGRRRVEILADGWFAAYRTVPLAPGQTQTLDVTLRHVPDGEPGD